MSGRDTDCTIEVTSLGFEGIAIGRHEGVVYFVKGALPGELVRARVVRKRKSHVEATLIEILRPSSDRIDAPCSHFGTCGGCKWQNLEYQAQVKWKAQHVVDSFERIGKVAFGTMRTPLACEVPYGYRNKMEFSFGASRWMLPSEIGKDEVERTDFALGLHIPERFDKILSVQHCGIQSDVGNTVLSHTHKVFADINVTAHHARRHEGFLKNLVVRTSATTGAVMPILVTSAVENERESLAVAAWIDRCPELPAGSTLIHAVNATKSPVARGEIVRCEGPGYLEECSMGIWYRISPFSFFQTNTKHLPALIDSALEAAALGSDDVIWDLYCGTGTLTLPAAQRARRVVGAELVETSIHDARTNAERNGIANVEWHALDLHAASSRSTLEAFEQPRVIIVDPPRAGMHPGLVDHIRAVAPERISYVSCNPATQARDCALLDDMYEVEWIQPVDMFPHTYHVENVSALRRRQG